MSPSSSAPARQTALQTTVSRTIRSTEANASVPVALDQHAPGRIARRARSRRGRFRTGSSPSGSAAPESGRNPRRASRDATVARPAVAGGKRIRPRRSTRVARTSRRASSWNSRTIGCQETRASTTPIRAPFSSVTGAARTATAPSSPTPEAAGPRRGRRRGRSRSPCGTRSPSPASGGPGPTKLPRPVEVDSRAARPERSGPGGRRRGSPAPSAEPKGSLPVSWRARRIASAAFVSCCAGRGVVRAEMWSAIAAEDRVRYFSSSVSSVRRLRRMRTASATTRGTREARISAPDKRTKRRIRRRPERPLTIASL